MGTHIYIHMTPRPNDGVSLSEGGPERVFSEIRRMLRKQLSVQQRGLPTVPSRVTEQIEDCFCGRQYRLYFRRKTSNKLHPADSSSKRDKTVKKRPAMGSRLLVKQIIIRTSEERRRAGRPVDESCRCSPPQTLVRALGCNRMMEWLVGRKRNCMISILMFYFNRPYTRPLDVLARKKTFKRFS
jgi:hypothetical protein